MHLSLLPDGRIRPLVETKDASERYSGKPDGHTEDRVGGVYMLPIEHISQFTDVENSHTDYCAMLQ